MVSSILPKNEQGNSTEILKEGKENKQWLSNAKEQLLNVENEKLVSKTYPGFPSLGVKDCFLLKLNC